MKKLILIKLGGSLITNKQGVKEAKRETISRLAREIKSIEEQFPEICLILGNGSGSFGHVSAAKFGTANGYVDDVGKMGMCVVENDAVEINRICVEEFLKEGVRVMGMTPMNILVAKAGVVESIYLESIRVQLEARVWPFVFGDVILDRDKGCVIFSCDRVIDELAGVLESEYEIDKVISVGDFEGVMDTEGKVVKEIDKAVYQNLVREGAVGGSGGTDVTGGMKAKLDTMMDLAKRGVESLIVDGRVAGNLVKAVDGEDFLGTRIKKIPQ